MDTATQTASLALYNPTTEQLLAEWTWQAQRRQTQDLLVAAQQMFTQVNADPKQIRALAVTTGPGSFTGVRIAISAAKGIGMGVPQLPQVIGIPTLAVTAAPWLPLLEHNTDAVVCAYLQAGRGRYNWVFFPQNNPLWKPTAADHSAGTQEELITALVQSKHKPIYMAGESNADLRTAVAELAHVCHVGDVSALRRAGSLAQIANHHLTTPSEQVDTLTSLQPLYLQAP